MPGWFLYYRIHICIYIPTGHFIRNTTSILGRTAFAQSSWNSLCYGFNKVDTKSFCCTLTRLHVLNAADLSAAQSGCQSPIPPHPKGDLSDSSPVTVEVKEFILISSGPVSNDCCFVTWHIILLNVAIIKRVNCGRKRMCMVSNNVQMGCGISAMQD